MLVLDIDGGKLSPQDFEDIFWHKAGRYQKRSIIIYNSFSRSPQHPNKFHVIFLFRKPAKSIEAFQAVYDAILRRIEEETGFSKREDTGIDPVCRSGIQPFYMPGTNRAYPESRYYSECGTPTRDIERHGIDPSAYIPRAKTAKSAESAAKASPNGKLNGTGGHQHITSLSPTLLKMKADLMSMKENRHNLFWDFGVRLRRHFRWDFTKVSEHYYDVAGSDPKMRKKASDNLKTLSKGRCPYRCH